MNSVQIAGYLFTAQERPLPRPHSAQDVAGPPLRTLVFRRAAWGLTLTRRRVARAPRLPPAGPLPTSR